MTERRRRTILIDEANLTALLDPGAEVVALEIHNNPPCLEIVAQHPDWEPIAPGAEAPLEAPEIIIAAYPVCAEGNKHGECVLINGHGQGGSGNPGIIPTTPHIDRYGSIWFGKPKDCQCLECQTYKRNQKAAPTTTSTRPTPGTFIQDTPPRGDKAMDHMAIKWEPCNRATHPPHWIETDLTRGIITNCQGRVGDALLEIPFR